MIPEAYIAGLFDGEGSVGRYGYAASKNGKKYYRLHVRITNTDRTLLESIQRDYGGKIWPKYDKQRNHGFDLHFTYREAEKFLRRILPYLILKRQKVVELIILQYPATKLGEV